jgi:hypothetical protein
MKPGTVVMRQDEELEGRVWPGVRGLVGARRIEDHAHAGEPVELMRLHGDRIAPGGRAGWWR